MISKALIKNGCESLYCFQKAKKKFLKNTLALILNFGRQLLDNSGQNYKSHDEIYVRTWLLFFIREFMCISVPKFIYFRIHRITCGYSQAFRYINQSEEWYDMIVLFIKILKKI